MLTYTQYGKGNKLRAATSIPEKNRLVLERTFSSSISRRVSAATKKKYKVSKIKITKATFWSTLTTSGCCSIYRAKNKAMRVCIITVTQTPDRKSTRLNSSHVRI